MTNYIELKNIRVNNLKNISLKIPHNKFIVITGVSGSGKSSLAFDTLYAEGQRRYVESLSSYARKILGRMNKTDFDYINNQHRPKNNIKKSTFNSRYSYRNIRLFKNALCKDWAYQFAYNGQRGKKTFIKRCSKLYNVLFKRYKICNIITIAYK